MPTSEPVQEAASPNSFSCSLTEQDDDVLLAAAKAGHAPAFEVLVRRYQSMVLGLAKRFTRSNEDAEDIAQQTFQKAFVHLCQFEGHSAFSTWLTRIAMNEALMWLRKKRRMSEVPLQDSTHGEESSQSLDFPDSGPNPEESCLRNERERLLSAALKELPPAMRRTIELSKLEELSLEETSQQMGISVVAVKSRLFHARRILHERLKAYWGSAARRRVNTPNFEPAQRFA